MVLHIESTSDFKRLLEHYDAPIVVDFTATWCGPCKAIAPVFEDLSNMSECKDLLFVKVDVDKAEELSSLCNVSAMPTFQAYYKKKKIHEFTGASKDNLISMVNAALAKYYE